MSPLCRCISLIFIKKKFYFSSKTSKVGYITYYENTSLHEYETKLSILQVFFINIIIEFLYINFIHQVAAHYYCNNNRVTSLENRGRAELTEAYY